MKTQFKANTRLCMAVSLLLVSLIGGGCGGGSGKTGVLPLGAGSSAGSSAAATRGQGKVAFTVHWPTAAGGRLVPLAAKALKFTVVESEAPNNVVVLTKIAPRPADSETTSTVLLDGLPTVLVTIKAEAYPNADATGVVQASGTVTVQVNGNQTAEKTVTLDSTVKTVEVTAAAPVTIGADGKFSLNLSDQSNPDSLKAQLTATAYNAAHEIVLTALDKWVYKSAKPDVAKVEATGGTRAEGYSGAIATVTALGAGDDSITVTESESQVSRELTVSVAAPSAALWNQPLGDAQNSSCTSGPGIGGNIVSSFATPKTGATSANDVFSGTGESLYGLAEFPNGTLGIVGVGQPEGEGIFVYDKSGIKQDFIGAAGFTIGAPDHTPLIGADGTLYSVSETVTKVIARGASNWTFDFSITNSGVLLCLSGDGQTLYLNTAGALYALDARTGAMRWQVSVSNIQGGSGFGKPAVSLDSRTVYATTATGVSAFDAATGQKRWDSIQDKVGGCSYVGVGPTGTVYAAINSVATSNTVTGFGIIALNPANGATLWTRAGLEGPYVLSRNGTVYGVTHVASSLNLRTSYVTALNGSTGTELWTTSKTYFYTQFAITGAADGTVYVETSEGDKNRDIYGLAALNGSNGSEKWTIEPDIITFSGGGQVYQVGSVRVMGIGRDGTVYAAKSPPDINSPTSVIGIR